MNITMDKKYTYGNGEPARILCVDRNCKDFPVLALAIDGTVTVHTAYGRGLEECWDLIEEWQPQDKEPVWAWDNKAYRKFGRVLQFYDAKNKCLFYRNGKRDGPAYDNYAKVEHYAQWMLDAQAKLED